MNDFILQSDFKPTGDQPEAIAALTKSAMHNKETILVGVTGSGKTYTIANVIANLQRPTLIISHNKTLAAQLYQEFKEFFPHNAVSYFVSYYDYYQPESYLPQSNTYIEKETEINEEIDKLRLAATTNILTRKDSIVVASVSCIYNIGSPREYGHFVLELQPGVAITKKSVIDRLVQLQYTRNNWEIRRGEFRVRGEAIDIYPAYEEHYHRIIFQNDVITTIESRDPLTGLVQTIEKFLIVYPAKHYMTDPRHYKEVFALIMDDMERQEKEFLKKGKFVEAQRIRERVTHDLEMIQEVGYVNGIENYSRYFDGRAVGDAPYTLFDYFSQAAGNDTPWLLCVDESHMTIPQIRGMYNGDRSRKQTLIDYGFRLPSALDNRPLTFDEFLRKIPQTMYVSATPSDWEYSRTNHVVEQLVRPTGLLDPQIIIRPVVGQIQDIEKEIMIRVEKKERSLITTLTKQMAEDLTDYLKERKYNVAYIHSDVQTLERTAILKKLRQGEYDIIVGVNLLREGLDLPEVSLVAILDADKQGFLRSKVSLIQTMGRAARHKDGTVILYADTMTDAIKQAIEEVDRRRNIQIAYNKKHSIIPTSISKPIRDNFSITTTQVDTRTDATSLEAYCKDVMTPLDTTVSIKKLKNAMKQAVKNLRFEDAAMIRDTIRALEENRALRDNEESRLNT